MQARCIAVSAITAMAFVTGIDRKIHLRQTVARVAAGKGLHRQHTKKIKERIGHG
jgi:hypothetical protein